MTFRSDLPQLNRYPYWSFDTETDGLNYPINKAIGVSFATPDGQSWYFDLRERDITDWMEDMFGNGDSTIIGFNVQFDVLMSHAAGIHVDITERLSDAAIRACLIDEHLSTVFPWKRNHYRYSLDDLSELYLGERKDTSMYQAMSEIFGGPATRSGQAHRIWQAPSHVVAPYAKKDAVLTLKLWEWQEEAIEKAGLWDIDRFERRAMPTVIRTAKRGVPVDPDRAERAMGELTIQIDKQQKRLDELAGKPVNVNSSPQIRELFSPRQMSDGTWMADNGVVLAPTGKGAPSINREALAAMEGDPRAEMVDEVRSLIKTRDTFLGKYICKDSYMNRVYPTINQTAGEEGGTKTGRFSYVDPALQQIPSRNKEAARIVKSCFPAPEGMVWVDSDLASFEVRVFAHLVAQYNRTVMDAYAAVPEMDFHQYVADLTHLPRNPQVSGGGNAKQLNLSMIFNSGNGAIAWRMGMDWEWSTFSNDRGQAVRYRKAGPKALAVIEEYHSKVQGVRELAGKMREQAENLGWVETEYGRRLRFPRKYKSYKASGLLIQATAADINKENWILVEEALGDIGHLILNTHDSYSMAMDIDQWESGWKRVKEAIERPVMRVPLILELSGVGNTWWDAISK